jgi:UDP-glucose 4-epimerase
MKILITGGAGFIGSYLANFLSKEHTVHVVDNMARGIISRLNSDTAVFNVDLTDIRELEVLPRDYDWIFHLAAVNGTDNFYGSNEKVFTVGFKSIINLYDYFEGSGASLVVASTAEVYQTPIVVPTRENEPLKIPDVQNPRYSYGGSKIFSELLVFNYKPNAFKKVVIFRPHNIYGPNMGYKHVIPQLIQKVKFAQLNKRKHIELIGSGKETRAFCYVDDVIQGLSLLLERGSNREIYHIGNSTEEISIFELAKNIIKISGVDLEIQSGENSHFGGTSRRCPDISKMKSLGFSPQINLEIGLERTWLWYSDHLANDENVLL